ncbi:MAG: glycine--tRNA ligase subunit alpha [Caldiserica bacterium]|jgi:glycyl-tRNA synthetase alpha chain|nr:glycine--tRNA ligase subunit alpha [Caldisericota bacterium]
MNLQDLILNLEKFWAEQGCVIEQPYDLEVGAGTMHPATFFRVLGPRPWRTAYVQPSRRPADGRFGENPYRLYRHFQFQVILKPSPIDVQDIYLESLKAIGLDLKEHDIRFEEDNWESPTLGAWGTGWQVTLDGLEITQFTYFQQAGGFDLKPISAELTYGLERLAMYLQGVKNVFHVGWSENTLYGDLHHRLEVEACQYSFRKADIERLWQMFDLYEKEAGVCIENKLAYPAYEYALKLSHTFNVLDARGALSVAQRAEVIGRIREIAKESARLYLEGENGSSV